MDFNNNNRPISSVNNYLNVLYKLRCNKINLFFNKTCQKKKIIPNYIRVQINNKSHEAQMTKAAAEKLWLKKVIKKLYTKINLLTMKVYNMQLQLSKDFHYIEYLEILEQIDNKIEKRLRYKRRTINKKLKTLIQKKNNMSNINRNKPTTSHKFYNRIENHTNIQFNNNETSLLEKGLKYNITPKNDTNHQNRHLMNIENAITKTNIEQQADIRTLIVDKIKDVYVNHNNHNNEHKTVAEIKNKICTNNAIITKADKGNTIVIMNENDYITKVNDFINTNDNIQELSGDPTQKYHKDLKDCINKSKHFLNDGDIRYNKMIKPTAPVLRGMPKIHKPNMPIRPVVNFTTAPSYKIAKHINKWLSRNLKFKIDHSIKNHTELVNKIEGIQIPNNAKLASFDVTNMYSNIPVKETLLITKNLLIKNGINNGIVDEILKLLEIITNQNYFVFREKFYKQEDGLPMGSPLSGTLANIYLNHIESEHILNSKNKFANNIKYWHRYVDDILLLFTGTNRQLEQLLQYINNIHPNIKFTVEIEQDKMINFLDLTIKHQNGKHTFKIFRKPTQTDQTIHIKSNHPYQHKIAAYNHMLHRLNNVPMSTNDYHDELNTIKYIANQNGYKSTKIDEINNIFVNKIKYQQNTTLRFNDDNEEKYVSVEYNKQTSHHIQKIFKNFGYKVAYKTHQKLEQQLKSRNGNTLDTGIYKLTCSDCPSFYIGQTGRSFKQRFKEHVKDIGKIRPESRYAMHINDTLHNYKDIDTNLEILYRMKKSDTMNRIEEFEIYKNRKNKFLLNNKINFSTNKIYEMILQNPSNQ